MILDIVEIGDPVLRRKAHKITQIDRDIRLLADDMVETLRDSGGVGLAAPQIGESIRMIVVEYPEDDSVEDSPMKTYKVINPEIIWRSEETVMGNEGCLSIPGYVGTVERNESIKVKGLSVFGRPLKISASGWMARISAYTFREVSQSLSRMPRQSVACARAMKWMAITWKAFSTT